MKNQSADYLLKIKIIEMIEETLYCMRNLMQTTGNKNIIMELVLEQQESSLEILKRDLRLASNNISSEDHISYVILGDAILYK